MIDHFVYKKDIQKIINMNISQIKKIKTPIRAFKFKLSSFKKLKAKP